MPSQIGSRMAFQNAANAVKRAGLNPANAVLSQSYLRCEVLLSASITQYKFDVLVNESTNGTINTQQKLNLQDAFVVNQIGFYLAIPSSSTDTTFRLLTYPMINATAGQNTGTVKSFVYNGTLASNTAAQALAIYNGSMQLNVNQRTVLTAWDLQRHLYIPPTQAGTTNATTAAVVSMGAVYHATDDYYNAADMGLYPCEPNIVLAGNKKNDLTVSMPIAPATIESNSRLVFFARGILAQNVTPIN